MSIQEKVAVVTGGGSGIGEAISLRLSRDGARVAVLDVNEDAARLTAKLCGGVAVKADVSDGADVDRALVEAEAALGPVDIWVNNAGIARPRRQSGSSPAPSSSSPKARAARL